MQGERKNPPAKPQPKPQPSRRGQNRHHPNHRQKTATTSQSTSRRGNTPQHGGDTKPAATATFGGTPRPQRNFRSHVEPPAPRRAQAHTRHDHGGALRMGQDGTNPSLFHQPRVATAARGGYSSHSSRRARHDRLHMGGGHAAGPLTTDDLPASTKAEEQPEHVTKPKSTRSKDG